MIKLNLKLFFLIKVFIIFSIICLTSYAEDPTVKKNMVVIGSNDAIVKIKVFSSFTCPHCASFHIKIVPEIKKNMLNRVKCN